MIKCVILTEGGRNIGFGHITRCLSLCQAFRFNKIVPLLVINCDKGDRSLIKGKNIKFVDWTKQKKLSAILKEGYEFAIVDSYLATNSLYQEIARCVKFPAYLDDNNRISYPKGTVINGTVNSECFIYEKNRVKSYLLGSRFVPLRKDFWRGCRRATRKTVKNILVTFGGDDKNCLTPMIVKLLAGYGAGINVVVGKWAKNRDIVKIRNIAENRIILHTDVNAERMKFLMLQSDICVSAAGQTLYELARTGTPTIAVAVADNQMNNVKGWMQKGFIEYAGWWQENKLKGNIISKYNLLQSARLRRAKARIGQKVVDGRGALRIVAALKNKLKK